MGHDILNAEERRELPDSYNRGNQMIQKGKRNVVKLINISDDGKTK